MPGWRVVKFIEDDTIEVVPTSWILEDGKAIFCLWPPAAGSSLKVAQAIKEMQAPNATWVRCPIEILSTKIYTEFDNANRKAKKALYSTDISSGPDSQDVLAMQSRRKIKRPRRYSSSSAEQDGYPLPPKNKIINESTPVFIDMGNISQIDEAELSYSSNMFPSSNSTLPLVTILGSSLASGSQGQNSSATLADITLRNSSLTSEIQRSRSITSSPVVMSSCISRPGSQEANINTTPTSVRNSGVSLALGSQEEFQKQVLRQLFMINARLKTHDEYFSILIQNQQEKENQIPDGNTFQEEMFNLPVQTEAELVELEENLSKPDSLDKLIKLMATVGGRTSKEFIRRIMPRLLADPVAKLYSYIGAKGKRKFAELKLSEAVKGSAKRNSHTKDSTEKEIELLISIWLSKATDRMNRKKTV